MMLLSTLPKRLGAALYCLVMVGIVMFSIPTKSAWATAACCLPVAQCDGNCTSYSANQTERTIEHIDTQFTNHREWLIRTVFEQNILPALMLFTEQMTAAAMHQVMTIGMFLDAKHQLETQRLLQQMMAEAHKDYHPSEGMCTFGTAMRSLALSDRNTEVTAAVISARGQQRELLSGSTLAGGGATSDYQSRIAQFRAVYCNLNDNAGQMGGLCPRASYDTGRTDRDINYTSLIDAPLTLMVDFTEQGDADHASNRHNRTISADEEDILALSANLYAHKVAPTVPSELLADRDGNLIDDGTGHYMNVRALAAKRSVARNSFAAIAAMKSQGGEEAEPYLYAIMAEFGISNTDEIRRYLGERPSYHAQMEILTKKLYQNPTFYTELYDKPANISRKTVAMQAIELMQRRDMYRSVLRSEATLSVMLETTLLEEESRIVNEINRAPDDGEFIHLPLP